MLETFDWQAGDHASYELGNAPLAVELAKGKSVAIDIETAGLGIDAFEIKAVSIGDTQTAVVLDPDNPRHRVAIRDAVALAGQLALHNAPFDVPSLIGNGLMRLGDIPRVYDTLVDARLAHPGERVPKGLGDCCTTYLGGHYRMWKASLEHGFKAATHKSKSQMFRELGLSSPAYVAYSAFDVIMTARLAEAMPQAIDDRISSSPSLAPADPVYLSEREQTINRMLLHRMSVGIEIDEAVVADLKDEMWATVAQADRQLRELGVNTDLSRELIKRDAINRLDQLGALGPRWPRLNNGQPSADKRYLERISAHPIVSALNLRSQADRFASDYADKLVSLARHDGRIHPQVGVLAAVTGRMSVNDPPLQQFPPSVRRMMRFDEPSTSLDWASIEPVFFGNAVGERDLITSFEAGEDLYLPVAQAAGVPRKVAKVVLLAQLYGQSVGSLAAALGRTEDDTAEIVHAVMSKMPRIKQVTQRIKNVCGAIGLVQTVSGRVLPIAPDLGGYSKFRGYLGVNYYVQGSCYDLLAEALYEIHQRGLSDALGMAVHDELVVATEAADEIELIMCTPPAALIELAGRVPRLRTGRVDMGHHWIEKG